MLVLILFIPESQLPFYFKFITNYCALLDDGIERFRCWLGNNNDASIDIIVEELRAIQTMASLSPASRPIIYIGSLFSEAVIVNKEIETYSPVLKVIAPSSIQQRHLIAAFEWFCGVKFPSLVRYFPIILKVLFDEDLVEEEVFLKWGTDLTRNAFSADHSMISLDTLELLKNSAAPFLKWLEEAEEEGDEEDDEEEDEEEDVEED